jgi:threonine/homoserine efflux transporter RhtA
MNRVRLVCKCCHDKQNPIQFNSPRLIHILVNLWSTHMAFIFQLLKSKTIVFAILLSILPLFAQYIGVFNLTPMQQMIACQVIAACVAVLRIITTQPISDK